MMHVDSDQYHDGTACSTSLPALSEASFHPLCHDFCLPTELTLPRFHALVALAPSLSASLGRFVGSRVTAIIRGPKGSALTVSYVLHKHHIHPLLPHGTAVEN